MFLRSDSGLSNRALFTEAQYTLYVEGGGGLDDAGSSDVIFWGDVVRTLRSDLKVSVVPLGGKPELEAVADKISSGQVVNTLVAMDSDFDEILNHRKLGDCVLYTYGYSWENDAFSIELFSDCLLRVLKVEDTSLASAESARIGLLRCFSELVPWVNADFWLRIMNSSLFPKVSPGRFIKSNPATAEVSIDRREIWKVCKQSLKAVATQRLTNRPNVWLLSTACFLQGHVYRFLVKQTLNYALKLMGRRKSVSEDAMEHIMISLFCKRVSTGDDFRSRHYRTMLKQIPSLGS